MGTITVIKKGSQPAGPGTELKRLLERFRFFAGKCDCNYHVWEMNRRGIEWCSRNIPTIVGWLEVEYRKLDSLIPFSKQIARQIVKLAIRTAKRTEKRINERSKPNAIVF